MKQIYSMFKFCCKVTTFFETRNAFPLFSANFLIIIDLYQSSSIYPIIIGTQKTRNFNFSIYNFKY